MKIYLSPSDQWTNSTQSGHSEAYHCGLIANKCAEYLTNSGYTVKVGDNSKEKTYTKRAQESNSWGSDLHICIHTNAGGGDGTLVECYKGRSNNAYVKNIYNEVATLTPTKDDGIREVTNIYEISHTNAVCVYVECEFHDNATTEKWIDEHINDIAMAIANGVLKTDLKPTISSSTSVSAQATNGKLYHVQVGAFVSKTNAEILAKSLADKGYDTYITYY